MATRRQSTLRVRSKRSSLSSADVLQRKVLEMEIGLKRTAMRKNSFRK